MASYPTSIFSTTNPSGSNTLASPDHANQHTNANNEIIAIETALGTTAGTSVLKNFVAGNFPVRINSSGTLQDAINGGTISSSSFSGGTMSFPNIQNAVIGTSAFTGGTANNQVIGTPAITGGTANAITLGTPLVNHFTSTGTTVPVTADRSLAPTVGTLSDSAGGTITANAPSQQVVEITFGTTAGNRTLGTPTNPVDGMYLGYRIKQNSNNTGTIAFATVFRFGQAGTLTLGTQSTWNYFGFRYSATDSKWDHQGSSLGLI